MLLRVIKTTLMLVGMSLVLGLVLSALNVRPSELPSAAFDAIGASVRQLRSLLGWAWPYVALGATVVLPAWLVLVLLRWYRRR